MYFGFLGKNNIKNIRSFTAAVLVAFEVDLFDKSN